MELSTKSADTALLRYIIEHRFVTADRPWSVVLSNIATALRVSPRYIRMALSLKQESSQRLEALDHLRLRIDHLATEWSDTKRYGQCCSAAAHVAMAEVLRKGDDNG